MQHYNGTTVLNADARGWRPLVVWRTRLEAARGGAAVHRDNDGTDRIKRVNAVAYVSRTAGHDAWIATMLYVRRCLPAGGEAAGTAHACLREEGLSMRRRLQNDDLCKDSLLLSCESSGC